jgi:hypothetical protein
MRPRYAPAFHDWSETGPGVSKATRKSPPSGAAESARSPGSPAQASATLSPSVANSEEMWTAVDKRPFWMGKSPLTVYLLTTYPVWTNSAVWNSLSWNWRYTELRLSANWRQLREDDLVHVAQLAPRCLSCVLEVTPLRAQDQIQEPFEIVGGVEADPQHSLLLSGQRQMHVRL